MRILVAGFGNELRGDDGFGVAVCHRLDGNRPEGVEIVEIGTAGLRLAQQLISGYDRLIVVDAMARGGSPGNVYVVEVREVGRVKEIDGHLAVPAAAMALAQAMKVLPKQVFLVGCEPGGVDELTLELSPPVRAAVDVAVARVVELAVRP